MRRGVVIGGALLALSIAACDLKVGPGQTTTLGNGGQVFGSPGDAQRGGNIAVDVDLTGSLVVQDADVFGGDDAVLKPADIAADIVMGTGIVRGGAAIRAKGGRVTLLAGTVEGGDAHAARGFGFAGNGIELVGSTLRVEGGAIRAGRTMRGAPGRAVAAVASTVELTAGSIDDLQLWSSTAVVSGGSLGSVVMGPMVFDAQAPPAGTASISIAPEPRNCLEISGGEVRGPLRIESPTDLFVRGTTFNLPFGEVIEPDPIPLVGRLVDGSSLATFVFRGSAGSRVFLIREQAGLVSGSSCARLRL